MAFNPNNIETITVEKLPSIAFNIANLIVQGNLSGVLGKGNFGDFATFIAPYITAVGASGFVGTTETALPSPGAGKFTFVSGPATFTQTTGGNIVTVELLNILGSNATTWSLIKSIPINILDLSALPNLLNINESQFNGSNIGRWTSPWPSLVPQLIGGKLRLTFTSGQNQWIKVAGLREATKTYKVGLKIRLVSGGSGLITVGTATGAVLPSNFKITPTSTESTYSNTIVSDTLADLWIGVDAPNNTGQVIDIDDVYIYELKNNFDTAMSLHERIRDNAPYKVLVEKDPLLHNGTSLRDNLAFFSLRMAVPYTQKYTGIRIKAWGGLDTKVKIRLYETIGVETLISEMTSIQEWDFSEGELTQDSETFTNLALTNPSTVEAGKKLVVFIFTESGTNVKTYQVSTASTVYSIAETFLYINPAPANPFVSSGTLAVSDPTSASKSEAFKLIDVTPIKIATTTGVGGVSVYKDPNVLISNLSELTQLVGFTMSGGNLVASGVGTFGSKTVSHPAVTVIEEVDWICKITPTATGTGGLEFGPARRASLAGTAVTIGNDGAVNFLRIYKLDVNVAVLSEQVTLPFTVEIGTTYQIRLGKRAAQLIVEVWDGKGGYFLKDDRYQTDAGINIGGMWGQPTIYAVKGDILISEVKFITPLNTSPLMVVFGNSFIEGVTLGVDRSGRYIKLLEQRVGTGQISLLGRGGEGATTISNRFDYELEWFKGAKYAYLPLGVNDYDYPAWVIAIQSLITKVKNKGMIPILATFTPRGDFPAANTKTEQQNIWVKASGELYIDVRAAVTNTDGTWKAGAVMVDGIHPSLLGHELIYYQGLYNLPFLMK